MEPEQDVLTTSATRPGIANVEHVPALGPIAPTGARIRA
jgi:hypothetical protein